MTRTQTGALPIAPLATSARTGSSSLGLASSNGPAGCPFGRAKLLFRTDLQLANDALLPLEAFSVGGAHSVRGYREDQFVRDNGWASSLEWRVPVVRLPIPYLTTRSDEGMVQIAPFFDIGRSWFTDLDTPAPELIYSIGLGVRWDPTRHIHAELYWGEALTNVETPGNDLQDDGIHFQVLVRLF